MTDDVFPLPFVRALYAEHCATPGGYRPPEDVQAANQALKDLVARIGDRAMTRDERRLASKYAATRRGHEDAVMAKHPGRAAPPLTKEATQ